MQLYSRLIIIFLYSFHIEAKDLWINYVPVSKKGLSSREYANYRPDDSDIKRTLNALPEETTMRQKSSLSKKPNIQFALAIGSSTISDRVDENNEALVATELNKNTYIGLQASYRARSVFGVDAEYFRGITAQHEILPTVTASLKQNGVMLDSYIWFPVPGLSKYLAFRAGIGIGLLDITATTSTFTNEGTASTGSMGVYSVLGAELNFGKFMTTYADFSESFSEKVYVKNPSSDLPDNSITASGGKFNRIRIGTSFHITRNISIGAQYTKRMINLTSIEGSSIFDEVQYMGMLHYRL